MKEYGKITCVKAQVLGVASTPSHITKCHLMAVGFPRQTDCEAVNPISRGEDSKL